MTQKVSEDVARESSDYMSNASSDEPIENEPSQQYSRQPGNISCIMIFEHRMESRALKKK